MIKNGPAAAMQTATKRPSTQPGIRVSLQPAHSANIARHASNDNPYGTSNGKLSIHPLAASNGPIAPNKAKLPKRTYFQTEGAFEILRATQYSAQNAPQTNALQMNIKGIKGEKPIKSPSPPVEEA